MTSNSALMESWFRGIWDSHLWSSHHAWGVMCMSAVDLAWHNIVVNPIHWGQPTNSIHHLLPLLHNPLLPWGCYSQLAYLWWPFLFVWELSLSPDKSLFGHSWSLHSQEHTQSFGFCHSACHCVLDYLQFSSHLQKVLFKASWFISYLDHLSSTNFWGRLLHLCSLYTHYSLLLVISLCKLLVDLTPASVSLSNLFWKLFPQFWA